MWRFVQLSDPHLASQRDGEWNNRFLCSMMPGVMRCLARDLAELRPEFILATGDIASTTTREALFEAREQMDSLGVPYYPMGGNHDFVVTESRDWFRDAFKDRLPGGDTFYSFDHNNLHFVVLDWHWMWTDGSLHPESEASIATSQEKTLAGARWALPQEMLDWLDRDLSIDPTTPAVVAVHFPAVRIPDRMRRPKMRDGGCLENGQELLNVLKRHPRVKAIFSGHVHVHFIEALNGLTQVVTGALPEFPTEYRDVHVYPDRLEIHTRGLSDPSFAERASIPGKDWTQGTPQDRFAVIPL